MNKDEMKKCVQKELHHSRTQNPTGVLGVISAYDRYTNTASVITSQPDTDEIDEVMRNVPCPVLLGIQSVAPEPGRPCFVVFKNGNRTKPLISHYYNHNYDKYDYSKQNKTHIAFPSYLINL